MRSARRRAPSGWARDASTWRRARGGARGVRGGGARGVRGGGARGVRGRGARGVSRGGARVSAPRPCDAFSNLQPPQPARLCFATSSLEPWGRILPPETRRADAASLSGCGGPLKGRGYRPVGCHELQSYEDPQPRTFPGWNPSQK